MSLCDSEYSDMYYGDFYDYTRQCVVAVLWCCGVVVVLFWCCGVFPSFPFCCVGKGGARAMGRIAVNAVALHCVVSFCFAGNWVMTV